PTFFFRMSSYPTHSHFFPYTTLFRSDPAVGTGTYLVAAIGYALQKVRERSGEGAVAGRATQMAENMYGFEILVGPYAVAHLRLRSEEHTSELQSLTNLVCRLLLDKKN